MPHAYPLMLDLTGKTVLIVGGGTVAARKAAGVLAAGGRVRAVAPRFVDEFPAEAQRLVRPYEATDVCGVDLAFAATDVPAVNGAVLRDARARRVWVGNAGEAAAGDVVTPASFAAGPVTVAVSAGSAALGVRVRDGLRDRFDPIWAAMATAMADLRPAIRGGPLAPGHRRDVFRDLASDDAFSTLAAGGPDGLKRWLVARHPDAVVV